LAGGCEEGGRARPMGVGSPPRREGAGLLSGPSRRRPQPNGEPMTETPETPSAPEPTGPSGAEPPAPPPPPPPSAPATADDYPVHLEIERQEEYSRFMPLIKWLLAIPH